MTISRILRCDRSIQRHLVAGCAAVLTLVGGAGAWAGWTEISGAVIASGVLGLEGSVKKVQHLAGGIVGELMVHEGDRVEAGALLLRLDETQVRANLQIILRQLDELSARRARGIAERDGASEIKFDVDQFSRRHQPEISRLLREEERLFINRRSAREGQKSQLKEQVSQLGEQIQGLTQQIAAKEIELEWAQKELSGVRELWDKKLVQFTRVSTLERDLARLAGDKSSLAASVAQAKGRTSEIALKILQIDEDLRGEVGRELSDLGAKISELSERRIAADDSLRRMEIRAPVSGAIHQLNVHTIGGVVVPNEPIMLIVPNEERLMVEARVASQDIDQLSVGQTAVARFTAFNQRTTPEINCIVSVIAADVTQDPKTGLQFYSVRLTVPQNEMSRLEQRLVPGMPAEIFFKTGSRTVLSYLVKPLHDQVTRAWRER